MLVDLLHLSRNLRRSPASAVAAILTLSLTLGAGAAIFAVVHAVLLTPPPFDDPDALVTIGETPIDGPEGSPRAVRYGTFEAWRERAGSLAALEAVDGANLTLTEKDAAERLSTNDVTPGFLALLGVTPALGRAFEPDDVGRPIAILSHALWYRRFGGDPSIIGRPITLDSSSHLVVGIMPPDFENVLAPSAELWAPMQYGMSEGRTWGHHLNTVGRLRPGSSLDQAARELTLIGRDVLDEHHPATYRGGVEFLTTSLQNEVTREVKPTLLISFVAVILVLVIACVNVTNLLLARAVYRRDEFRLRAALGAPRRRLVRQLLTESLLLAVLGGVAGIVVVLLSVRALMALRPPNLPRAGAIDVDITVFAFALGIVTVIGLVTGVMPALQTARCDPNESLLQQTLRTTRRPHAMRGEARSSSRKSRSRWCCS